MPNYIKHIAKILLLTTTLLIAQIVILSIFPPPAHKLFEAFEPSFTAFVFASLLESIAIYWLIVCIDTRGQPYAMLKKVSIVFIMYWGTKYLQMHIETLFFLNLWQSEPLMSLDLLVHGLGVGLLVSLIFCGIAVFVVDQNPAERQDITSYPSTLKSFMGVAALYVPLYLLAGALLAIPIAADSFAHTYEALEVPIWMPAFQFCRGLLWASIIWCAIRFHRQQYDARLTLAVCLCILPTVQLIPPNPFMQDQLRWAHIVEMSLSMFIFGWLAVWIFHERKGSLWRLNNKVFGA